MRPAYDAEASRDSTSTCFPSCFESRKAAFEWHCDLECEKTRLVRIIKDMLKTRFDVDVEVRFAE